jgi:hypothetical protein
MWSRVILRCVTLGEMGQIVYRHSHLSEFPAPKMERVNTRPTRRVTFDFQLDCLEFQSGPMDRLSEINYLRTNLATFWLLPILLLRPTLCWVMEERQETYSG